MVTEGWVSITTALDRSTRWPVDHVCSARANAPHPHSEVPVGVQSEGALGFGQTVRHTPGDTRNRGSGI